MAISPSSAALDAEERLERGEVRHYAVCPFALPTGDDLRFLLAQRAGFRAHKNVSLDPVTGRLTGFRYESSAQADRLRSILTTFSRGLTDWMRVAYPRYAGGWRPDRVSFRPDEEATRALRHTARNDLLHIDNFPTRPSQGWRILRVFANVNPAEPRVWVTSAPFARLLARFGDEVGLPGVHGPSWRQRVRRLLFRVLRPDRLPRTDYDDFMLRMHDTLKANDEFQERGPKKFWSFAPGSSWLAFTDACSHAVLRGRYALEHSFFVSPDALALPDESPSALIERAAQRGQPSAPPLRSAA